MLIAQITDIHLGFDPVDPDELNRRRLDRRRGRPGRGGSGVGHFGKDDEADRERLQ